MRMLAMKRKRMMRTSMAMGKVVAQVVVRIREIALNDDRGMIAILIARGSAKHSGDHAADYQ